jgi:predicted transposase/invertase (TIGR01784 family)
MTPADVMVQLKNKKKQKFAKKIRGNGQKIIFSGNIKGMRTEKFYNQIPWKKLPLSDNLIFCDVMERNPDVCKELLEMLLNIEIDRIEKPAAEKSIQTDPESKSVRMDVYVKDGTGRTFDVEMQTTHKTNLPKRARYYQSIMTVDSLQRGSDYNQLNDSFVIFLCLHDPFGKNLPIYSFKNVCAEKSDLELRDGTKIIFFNAEKSDTMPGRELRNFFNFLKSHTDPDEDSAFVQKLKNLVDESNEKEDVRKRKMTLEYEINEAAQERAKELAVGMAHDMAQNMAVGIAEEMAVGMAENIASERLFETARNFIQAGVSLDVVARSTGLSREQVERLKESL